MSTARTPTVSSDSKNAPDIIFSTDIALCGLYYVSEGEFTKANEELKKGNSKQFQAWLGKNKAGYVIYQNSSKEYVFKYIRENETKIECSPALPLKPVKTTIDVNKSKENVIDQLLVLGDSASIDRQSLKKKSFYCISETLTEEQLKIITTLFQHSHTPIEYKPTDPYYTVKIEDRLTKELQDVQPGLSDYKFNYSYKTKPQITITKTKENKVSAMTPQVLGAIGIPEDAELSFENRQKIKAQLQKHHSFTEDDVQNINTVGNVRELLKEYETLSSVMNAFMFFVKQSPYTSEEKSVVNKALIDIYFEECSSSSSGTIISTRNNAAEIPYTKDQLSLSDKLKKYHLEKYKTYTSKEFAEILNIISDFLQSNSLLQFLQLLKKGIYYFAFINECTNYTFSDLTRKPIQHLGQLIKVGVDSSNGFLDNIYSDFSKFQKKFPSEQLRKALDNFLLVKPKIIDVLKNINVDSPDVLDVAYEHKLLLPEHRKQPLFICTDDEVATTFEAKVKQREKRNKEALDKASDAIKMWNADDSKEVILSNLAYKYFDALESYTKVSLYGHVLNKNDDKAQSDRNSLEKLKKFDKKEEFVKKQDILVALYNMEFFIPKNKKIFEPLVQSLKKEVEERVKKLEHEITVYEDMTKDRMRIIHFLESLADLYTIQMLEEALDGQIKDEVQLQKRVRVINDAINRIKYLKCGLFLVSHDMLSRPDELSDSKLWEDERSEVYAIVENQPEKSTPQLYHLKKENNKKLTIQPVHFNGSYSVAQLKKEFGELYHLQQGLSSFALNAELSDQELTKIEFSMIDGEQKSHAFVPRRNSYKVELAHILGTLVEEQSVKKSTGIGGIVSSGASDHLKALIKKLGLKEVDKHYKSDPATLVSDAKEEDLSSSFLHTPPRRFSTSTTTTSSLSQLSSLVEGHSPIPGSLSFLPPLTPTSTSAEDIDFSRRGEQHSLSLPSTPMSDSTEEVDVKASQSDNQKLYKIIMDQQKAEHKSKIELREKINKEQKDKQDLEFKLLKLKKIMLDQEIIRLNSLKEKESKLTSKLEKVKEHEITSNDLYQENKTAVERYTKDLSAIKDNPLVDSETKEQDLLALKTTLTDQHRLSIELKELDGDLNTKSQELKELETKLTIKEQALGANTQAKKTNKTPLWKYILAGAVFAAGAVLVGTGIGAAALGGAAIIGILFLSLTGSGSTALLSSLFYSIYRGYKDINLENELDLSEREYREAKINYDIRKKEVDDLTALKIKKQSACYENLVKKQEQELKIHSYQSSLEMKAAISEQQYQATQQTKVSLEQQLAEITHEKEAQERVVQEATEQYEKILYPDKEFKESKAASLQTVQSDSEMTQLKLKSSEGLSTTSSIEQLPNGAQTAVELSAVKLDKSKMVRSASSSTLFFKEAPKHEESIVLPKVTKAAISRSNSFG